MRHFSVKSSLAMLIAVTFLLSLSVLPVSAKTSKEPGAAKNIPLHSTVLRSSHIGKGSKPDWSCFTTTFAGKVGPTTMWGQGYINCDTNMETIDMTLYAMYCQPVLWGCLWFNQGQMGPGCTYHNISANWCPSQGTYRWSKNIDPGELWGVQTYTCAYGYDGTSSCGGTMQEVQF